MLEPLLKQAGELPSLPEVYIRVTELLETESATGQKIGEAVQTDPVLTARILKLINSAYYGLQNPVTSISQAVTLLGRQHCIKTAIIARQLAMQNSRVIDHEAFFHGRAFTRHRLAGNRKSESGLLYANYRTCTQRKQGCHPG
jgi:HD-like signal output (HDOD) protein